MFSNNKKEQVNALIDEVKKLQAEYNALVKPLSQTKLELTRHQLLFNRSKTVEQETKEAEIIKTIQEKLAQLASPEQQKQYDKIKTEIDSIKNSIEALRTEIEGACDRSSPTFLQKIQ